DLYPEFAAALRNESGIDVELDSTGTLYVAFNESEAAELRARYVWQSSRRLKIEWLTKEEAGRVEPGLSTRVHCALRFAKDSQVDNRKLGSALRLANQKLGVRLIEGCEVIAVQTNAGKIESVQTSKDFIPASKIVLAAGAWSSAIDPLHLVQVEPVRGQM